MNSSHILGVRIDSLTLVEAIVKANDFLISSGLHTIFTPNPEMVVKAQKDEYFKKVLNSGDLNLCDGFGLSLVSRISRITGVDFMLEICKIAEAEGKSIYLLGSGSDAVVKKAAEELKRKFLKLIIVGFDKGPSIQENPTDFSLLTTPYSLPITADILFVAFGMGKQEKWIHANLSKLPSVKIAMGVGGAFDYLAGFDYTGRNITRAPRLMRRLGLEWLYRLFRQPERFKRIWNATIKFLFLCIFSKS